MIYKNLPRPYVFIHDKNLPHMPHTLCSVWSSFVTPVERFFMLPRSKLTYMPHKTSNTTQGIAKTCFHHQQINTPCSKI